VVGILTAIVAGNVLAQNPFISDDYRKLWDDPALQQRIEAGIRQNRMALAALRLADADGKPIAGAEVEIEQVRHDFLFGANIFLLGGFKTEEKNRRYEAVFQNLLNAASVPLYWKGLEPKQGQLRFAADSPPIYRRPPPDTVVAFCKANGLNMNGHPLVWDNTQWSIPDWLSPDPAERARLIRKRIGEIAGRYGKDIQRWDVLNERGDPATMPKTPMPKKFELLAFQAAQEALPASAILTINETTGRTWGSGRGTFRRLIEGLRRDGVRIDMVGLQFHFFTTAGLAAVLKGSSYKPADMLAAMDFLGELGLPLHVSEITLPSLDNTPAGHEAQAVAARNFYRLWFSHPRMQAITWWNLVDGTAAPGEDKILSGILDADLKPKPSYEALDRLINHDWKTRLKVSTNASGEASFTGFKGQYQVRVRRGDKTLTASFHLTGEGKTPIELRLQ
jgi:GH35 family endo-1,4-beta-xylanase